MINLIVPILVAILASYLTYLFSIKNLNRTTDLDRIRELNKVLADILRVWHNLTLIEKTLEIIMSDSKDLIIPKKYLPMILFKQGYIHDGCFEDLNNSLHDLKKYDPITYYRLDNLGSQFSKIKSDYIMPFFNEKLLENDLETIDIGAGTILNKTLEQIEETIDLIADLIRNKKVAKDVDEIVDNYLDSDEEEFIKEINTNIYEYLLDILPDELNDISFDDFMKYARTDEFKRIIEVQFKAIANGNFQKMIDIISDNPNMSMEELNDKL